MNVVAKKMGHRADADYTAEFVFTEPMARADVEAARGFVAEVQALLAQGGWTA